MPSIKTIIELRGRNCCYCDIETHLAMEPGPNDTMATKEHIVPRSKGGKDNIENLTIACYSCNTARGNKPIEVFLKSQYMQERIFKRECIWTIKGRNKQERIKNEQEFQNWCRMYREAEKENSAFNAARKTGLSVEEILLARKEQSQKDRLKRGQAA